MPEDRWRSRWRYWPLPLLMLLGIVLGVLHNRAVRLHQPDPTILLVQNILALPARMTTATAKWTSRHTGWLLNGYSLAKQNRKLQARLSALKAENNSLQTEADRGVRLSKLLALYQQHPKSVAARVIALRPDPNFDTILLNKGSSSGIHVHSVVITPDGLVGQVYQTTPFTSSVVLLTDPNGMVSARVQRPDSRAIGLCKGSFSPILSMIDLPATADIKPGDAIITAGFGIYPPGIPIGTVLSVAPDRSDVNKVAQIEPAAHFNRLDDVLVLQ